MNRFQVLEICLNDDGPNFLIKQTKKLVTQYKDNYNKCDSVPELSQLLHYERIKQVLNKATEPKTRLIVADYSMESVGDDSTKI